MTFHIGQTAICDVKGVTKGCTVKEVGASGFTYMVDTGTRQLQIGQHNMRTRRSHRVTRVKRATEPKRSWWPAFGEAAMVVTIVVSILFLLLDV